MTTARARTLALLAAVALASSPSLRAEAPSPPVKGDEIYVAATFKGIEHPKLVSGARMTYDMSPCKVLVIRKADAKKQAWTVQDALGNQERLEGPWLPWMFTTEAECKAFVASKGEAPVTKSGTTFRVTASPAAK